jgi:hypothetical protein
MKLNRRIAITLIIIVGLIGAVSLIGLPFHQFGFIQVQAQYTSGEEGICGGAKPTAQIRFFGDVTIYADAALTQPIATLVGSALRPQKFLLCPNTSNGTSVRVVFGTSGVYVPFIQAEAVRNAADNQ